MAAFQKSVRWRWVSALVGVALLSLFVGFRAVRANYENRLLQQILPSSAPRIQPRVSAQPVYWRTVLLLGDSRMEQWELPAWSGWRVVNAGYGGLTTGQLRLSAPRLLDEFHPDIVVIQIGINDLKYLGLRPELASEIVSLAARNLHEVVAGSRQRQAKVLLLETWPAGRPEPARRLVWNEAVPSAVEQFNARLRSLGAEGPGIRTVDLFTVAGMKPGPDFHLDALHFKAATYRGLTPTLEREIEDLLMR